MSKFVLIGVGSTVFGSGVIGDLLHFKTELAGSKIALVDTDPEALDLMTRFARKANRDNGSPFTVESSVNRREMLGDAEFVVTSPAIERERLWKQDWEIVKRAGIRQTYGENGGPGSLLLTLRNIPMMLGIAHDIEELCPTAWLINYTNPESRVCMALDRFSEVKTVGLCHQIMEGYRIVAGALGLEVGEIDVKAAGLNHFTFMYTINHAATGEDLYPRLREAVDGPLRETAPLSCAMYDLCGMFPTPGDNHLAEMLSFGWEYCGLEGRDFEYWRQRKLKARADVTAVLESQKRTDFGSVLSGERMVHMALAMLFDRNEYEISIDVRNDGAIPNLPRAAIVETPGVISSLGATPLHMPRLPGAVAAFMQKQIAVQELSVQAAVTGDRLLARQAMCLDPVIDSHKVALKTLDELLEANRPYISPRFFA